MPLHHPLYQRKWATGQYSPLLDKSAQTHLTIQLTKSCIEMLHKPTQKMALERAKIDFSDQYVDSATTQLRSFCFAHQLRTQLDAKLTIFYD